MVISYATVSCPACIGEMRVMRKSSVKSACVVFALTVLITTTAVATGREG